VFPDTSLAGGAHPERQTYHMKLKHYIATLLFILVNIGAAAAEHEYKSVDEFTRSLPAKPARTINIAEGDLNGDGLSDRAVVTDDGDGQSHQLYILLQARGGGFFVAQKTKQNGGFWQAVYLSIEKGSLFVNIEGMQPTSGARHQFKLYRGIWRLIGLRYTRVTGNTEEGGVATSGFDWNVITGDVTFDNEADKKNKRGKWTAEICRLEDYDFDPEFCTGAWKSRNSRQEMQPGT
jgi:hypothetical protein